MENQEQKAEPLKNIAYAMKDLAKLQKQVNIKVIRALRSHERRLERIEKHLGIQPSPKEILEINNTTDIEKELQD